MCPSLWQLKHLTCFLDGFPFLLCLLPSEDWKAASLAPGLGIQSALIWHLSYNLIALEMKLAMVKVHPALVAESASVSR